MKAFQHFEHLRNLELILRLDENIQIQQKSTDFLEIPETLNFLLKERIAEEHAVNLYKSLIGNGKYCTMESLNVKFTTNNQFNEWAFLVKAQSRDGTRFRVEKKYLRLNSVWKEGMSIDFSTTSGYIGRRPGETGYEWIPTDWDAFG